MNTIVTTAELRILSELEAMPEQAVVSWMLANPAQAKMLLKRGPFLRAVLARKSVNEFIELVGRDEETGKPLRQSKLHREMQRLANKFRRLLLWSHPEGGKTSQLSILRPIWRLGVNPNRRIVVVSETQSLSRKIVRAQQGYLENPISDLRLVFPHLRPGSKWTETAFDVTRKHGEGDPKDYSVQAIGVGSSVMGSRIDDLILDDVLTHDNTRTDHHRAEFKLWFDKTIMSRLSANASVAFIGNAWHPMDQMHQLAAQGWVWRKFPVLDPESGLPTWPEKWPTSRIEEKRESLVPSEFAREMLCEARSDEDARFKEDWINRCLRRGDGIPATPSLGHLPNGYRTYTGVDLGTRESAGADLTVFFTLILHPDGSREVLEVLSGRWTAPDIMARLKDVHRRFHSIVAVESNAAQDFIRQLVTKESSIPVLPFTTDKAKIDPLFGVETLAVEMFNGKWIIPSKGGQPATKEIGHWITEMLHYQPDQHTGDRLMASWIAKQAASGLIGVRRKGRTGSLRL